MPRFSGTLPGFTSCALLFWFPDWTDLGWAFNVSVPLVYVGLSLELKHSLGGKRKIKKKLQDLKGPNPQEDVESKQLLRDSNPASPQLGRKLWRASASLNHHLRWAVLPMDGAAAVFCALGCCIHRLTVPWARLGRGLLLGLSHSLSSKVKDVCSCLQGKAQAYFLYLQK